MVQVTEKPIEFGDDVKYIMGILSEIASYNAKFVQDFTTLVDYVERFRFKLPSGNSEYDRLMLQELYNQLFEVISDLGVMRNKLDELHKLGYLNNKFFNKYIDAINKIEETLKSVMSFTEALEKPREAVESIFKKIGTIFIKEYSEVMLLTGTILKDYALDPPENTKKDGMGLFEVLALGTMIVGGIIVLKNMGM